jgi:hypothetical protein
VLAEHITIAEAVRQVALWRDAQRTAS